MTPDITSPNPTQRDPLWYKRAVIYQAHVRSFCDSDTNGIGDFRGLTEKLDYLQDLGVTAIWLLPFYPSPLRDDGYDISDYCSINPIYGTLADFKAFLREAHKRGLRVITELVINHMSGFKSPAAPSGAASGATSMSGVTRRRSTRKRASSSRISSCPTGPGTRWLKPISGIVSIPISRT